MYAIERHRLHHRVRPLEVLACGEGEPLVLLHGWGLGGSAYAGAMRAFAADGWRVIAPTVSGGQRWTIEHAADLCAEAMAGLDVAHAPLVGHSYGGIVAAATAVIHPGFADALVAISTPFVSIGDLGVRRFLTPGRQYRLAGHRAAARAMLRTALSAGGLGNLARIARWFMESDRSELHASLSSLKIPRALVWAEHDSLFTPEIGKASAIALGGRLVRVDNADGARVDHDWPMRAPAHFAQTISGLVRVLTSETEDRRRR